MDEESATGPVNDHGREALAHELDLLQSGYNRLVSDEEVARGRLMTLDKILVWYNIARKKALFEVPISLDIRKVDIEYNAQRSSQNPLICTNMPPRGK